MIAQFPPVSFALVMATGIVSIACHLIGLDAIALFLFILNIIQYLTCSAFTLLRVFKYPVQFWQDLTHHQKGPAFLTTVAGTNILGSQFSILTPFTHISVILWFLGTALWLIMLYCMLAGVTVARPKPDFKTGISGAWLLCTVSSASVCVLGTFVYPYFSNPEMIFFICLTAYMVGIMLYLMVISQIFYRWIFIEMEPEAFSPSYWINMGALAISTLAGARLLIAGGHDPLIQQLAPFLLGFTLFLGACAFWWIPLLILVFLYKRIAYKTRISYDVQNWSVVFPLGMFCVASINYLPLVHQNWLLPYIHAFVWVALTAWILTFSGLLKHLFKIMKPQSS